MNRNTQQLVCIMFFGIGLNAGASLANVYTSSEEKLNLPAEQRSIEILALSRGRGVPENSFIAFQEIKAVANTALESGAAVSVRQETIGLEGETRLCIVFRDNQALATIGNHIRKLATNIELLQVNDNRCSGSWEEQPKKEQSL